MSHSKELLQATATLSAGLVSMWLVLLGVGENILYFQRSHETGRLLTLHEHVQLNVEFEEAWQDWPY